MTTISPFLPPTPAPVDPRGRLLCVPFAGGGAGIFRSWPAAMPFAHVVPLQLPGRERRLRERAYTAMGALIDDLAPAVVPLLDRPFAIFGHSMGAAIAFELARRLRDLGHVPAHLFLSARRAPGEPPLHPPLFALPDARLIAETERLYGPFPDVLKQHPELLAMFLPTLRADYQLLDTWRPADAPPLSCPLTVLGGKDDHAVPPEVLEGWRAQTTGAFRLRILPGGHFFARDADDARDVVASTLAAERP